jgi:endonuclease-3
MIKAGLLAELPIHTDSETRHGNQNPLRAFTVTKNQHPEIAAALVAHSSKLRKSKRSFLKYADSKEANQLINNLEVYPHAYVIGVVVDIQMKSERAWAIPHAIEQYAGGFEFDRLVKLTEKELQRLFKRKSLHRFPAKMATNVFLAIQRIADEYDGDASTIWSNKPSSAEVVFRFLQFQGIGQKLASMAANILARDFKVKFSDYYSIDVSIDVHLRRVFTRLGLVREGAAPEEIIFKARSLSPKFPGLLDLGAYQIGRQWCRPNDPQCEECYLGGFCSYNFNAIN